jgi:hypothetical protein
MKYLIILILLLSACTQYSSINSIQKWKDGIVYYKFDSSVNDLERNVVRTHMEYWKNNTNIEFLEDSTQEYKCTIYKNEVANDNSSTIGQKINSHIIFTQISWFERKALVHELGHILGLFHEHQRPDRDEYLIVNYDNILENYKHNFDIRDNPLYEEESLAYDYSSVMSYETNMYSNGNGPTIEVIDGELEYFNIPSVLDLVKINLIYE